MFIVIFLSEISHHDIKNVLKKVFKGIFLGTVHKSQHILRKKRVRSRHIQTMSSWRLPGESRMLKKILPSCLTYSQICLIPLLDAHQFPYLRKLRTKKPVCVVPTNRVHLLCYLRFHAQSFSLLTYIHWPNEDNSNNSCTINTTHVTYADASGNISYIATKLLWVHRLASLTNAHHPGSFLQNHQTTMISLQD